MDVFFSVMKKQVILLTLLVIMLAGVSNALATPVFDDVNVSEAGSEVVVRWTTLDESDCSGFYVERSSDGVNFTALHSVAVNPRVRAWPTSSWTVTSSSRQRRPLPTGFELKLQAPIRSIHRFAPFN